MTKPTIHIHNSGTPLPEWLKALAILAVCLTVIVSYLSGDDPTSTQDPNPSAPASAPASADTDASPSDSVDSDSDSDAHSDAPAAPPAI